MVLRCGGGGCGVARSKCSRVPDDHVPSDLAVLNLERKDHRRINRLARGLDIGRVPPDCDDSIALSDELLDSEIRVGLCPDQGIEVALDFSPPSLHACIRDDRWAGTMEFTIARTMVENCLDIASSERL